jgi:phenylacetate-coenzyme A ligase PaaK-like adenylate-forming protein
MSALANILRAAPRYLQFMRSQYWPREKLEEYQHRRLARTLRAAASIPFYRERMGANPRHQDLATLPTMSRADAAALNRSVVALHPAGLRCPRATSSGTSGPRAEYLFDRSHQCGRYAARARYLRANGWNPIQRSVWLVGNGFLHAHSSNAEPNYEDPQFVSRALPGVRFIVNSNDLAALAAEVAEIDPLYIYGYPSVVDGLLRNLRASNLRLPSLRRIFTGAEVVEDSLRERARNDFRVEISANYGSTEAFLAWQCPAGNYHQNAEHALLELVDEAGRAVVPGQIGRVLLTTLENYVMPLVRYDIGDYAVAASGSCPCGRTLPLMGRIVGRGMNLFRDLDGKLITTWDLVNVLIETPEVETYQIVQKKVDRVLVKYTANQPLTAAIENNIRTAFLPYLGQAVAIDFERVAEIPRMPSGKFMITLSELAP